VILQLLNNYFSTAYESVGRMTVNGELKMTKKVSAMSYYKYIVALPGWTEEN